MRKLLLIILMFISTSVYCQKTTFKNNYGTNIIKGKIGNFNKSSFSWTIEKTKKHYTITTNANRDVLKVVFNHYDKKGKSYFYKPINNKPFDNAKVHFVIANHKLIHFATGNSSDSELSIIFTNNTGYIFKLHK